MTFLPLFCRRVDEPRRRERAALALGDGLSRELLDRLVEQMIEIELSAQVQKHAAEPDRSAVHEHELARHLHGSHLLERLVHAESFAATVFAGLNAVSDAAHAIIE